jgi:hypothetical protein
MRRLQRLRRMRNRFYKRNVVAPPLPLIHLIAKSEKHLCSVKVSEVNPLVLISGEVLRIQLLLAGSQLLLFSSGNEVVRGVRLSLGNRLAD